MTLLLLLAILIGSYALLTLLDRFAHARLPRAERPA
jgi:hypothetical protein